MGALGAEQLGTPDVGWFAILGPEGRAILIWIDCECREGPR